MKHLVNVSGGAGSAVALFRVIERYGRDLVSASLADTNSEHPDLYRFADDVEREAGIEITRLDNNGLTIWDIFERELAWTNPETGGCLAAWYLKKVPLDAHANTLGDASDLTIHIGFSLDEKDRIDRLLERRGDFNFDFPLCWEPPMLHCDALRELKRRGIRECEVYRQGYPHSNCLKWNCIKSGIGQWLGVLKDNREAFIDAEEREQRILARMVEKGRKPRTILKDRVGGMTRNLSLRQLREEWESGVRRKVPDFRESTCSCFSQLLF